MDRSAPVLVFDSGYGGISVLKRLIALMPDEHYLYYGDSANAPYGPRPEEEIVDLTLRAVGGLLSEGPKAVVIACNTATAAALDRVKALLPELPVVGIRPALSQAEAAGCRRILCLATAGTLASASYARQLGALRPETEVVSVAAPGIVSYVEGESRDRARFEAYLDGLLRPVRSGGFDGVVLGCTHFPFAKGELRAALRQEEIRFFDAGGDTAEAVRRALESSGTRSESAGSGGVTFLNSLVSREALAHSWALLGTEI